ncbi:MAG: hypothetical protein LBK62_01965 [Treponema sp.]|jgi:hypothetical protein|nr:hypothetical protein [Treponema sp.]
MKKTCVFLCVGAFFILASCTTFTAVNLESGLIPGATDYEVLGNFTEREWVNKFLGQSGGANLLNLSSHATDGVVERAISKNLKKFGGTGITNLEISYGSNPIQWILNFVTFNIWAPSTVVVSGTVIRQK